MPDQQVALWAGYVFSGAITLLVAKVKAGKTTLLCHLIHAMLRGRAFLGRETHGAVVFLYTEEGHHTVLASLRRCGLLDETDLYILSTKDTRGLAFCDVVASIIAQAKAIAGKRDVLLVVDTISGASRPVDDDENSPSWAQGVVDALRPATELGWGVAITQHMRKSGGDIEDAARGSSALPGAVDVVVTLVKATTNGHPGRRKLEAVGRFDDVPAELLIELEDGSYRELGDQAAVERAATRAVVLEILPACEEKALDIASLLKLCPEGTRKATLDRALGREGNADKQVEATGLVGEGVVRRRRGVGAASAKAFGYWLGGVA